MTFKTTAEFEREYLEKVNYTYPTGYDEATYGYDSVWTIADVLNRTIEYMKHKGFFLFSLIMRKLFSNSLPSFIRKN